MIWHPDKRIHDAQEATEVFSAIQAAYEVLSDPQERSWYDAHKEAILRGDDPSTMSSYDSVPSGITSHQELLKYFSMHFSFDSQNGFYTLFTNLFDQLAKEELDAFKFDTQVSTTPPFEVYPSFAGTAYPKDFYDYWLSFASIKSFKWRDKWNLSDAPERNIRRAMEKENKKARDASKKEFNETVRNLAFFIRKRDPRYKNYVKEMEQKQQEKRLLDQQKLEAERKARAQVLMDYEEQEWSKVDQDVEIEELYDDLECVICDKVFRNDRQLQNHKTSRKHLDKIEELKREFDLDEEDVSIVDSESDSPKLEKLEPQSFEKSISEQEQVDDLEIEHETEPQDELEIVDSISSLQLQESQPVKISSKKSKKKKSKPNSNSKLVCNVCLESFDTRNALFTHVRDLDHASAEPLSKQKRKK